MQKQTSIRLTDEKKHCIKSRFGTVTAGVNTIASIAARMGALMYFFKDPPTALSCVTESFPVLIRRAWVEMREIFTQSELFLITHALKNTTDLLDNSNYTMGCGVISKIEDAFDFYGKEYEGTWGIQKDGLCPKLCALTSFQLAALELWVGAFWGGTLEPGHDDEMMAIMGG